MKSILEFANSKHNDRKISVITCYDYWSACLIAASSVDAILVGDSAAMVMHGHRSTLPIDAEIMALHVAAVSRGAGDKFIIGDLPFLSYRQSLSDNVAAVRLLMQAGAQAVKLEGIDGNETLIRHLVDSGVPVMGHLGLTPQSLHQLGGFKVQGRDEAAHERIVQQALRVEASGAFSLVLECVPEALATQISAELRIPVIGIGAGAGVDGQVLVLHDMLGLNREFKPKFVRQFAAGAELIEGALNDYADAVRSGAFPTAEESYS